MTAGRGIVHSEMPKHENGLLQGFQLWVNLPASKKMTAPSYQEYPASSIPEQAIPGGGRVRVIAGTTDAGATGPVVRDTVSPLYLDVSLEANSELSQHIPESHSAFIHVIEGSVRVGESGDEVPAKSVGVLSSGSRALFAAGERASRFLLIAGRRIGEPVARYGPFVMNTQQELLQAFRDFETGRF
jgi:redox-sensitive bicupin YhaK (pirin superfamily)